MAIIGLTVGENGEAIQRLAVHTKVSIGEVVEIGNGKTRPGKLDHFVFQQKETKTFDWELDPELMAHYGEECREIGIVLLDDNIENVFRTEYAWWSATEKKCWGDGRNATRRTPENPQGESWSPCGFDCEDLVAKRCAPSGDLYFVLQEFPRLGSVCVLHTKGRRSIRQICSALTQIRTVTGGRLAGVSCNLTVQPVKTSYADGAKKKSTTVYALNIEISASEMRKMLSQMTQYAQLFSQTAKLLGDGRKIEFEEESEATRAADIAGEFYPASEIQQPRRASELDTTPTEARAREDRRAGGSGVETAAAPIEGKKPPRAEIPAGDPNPHSHAGAQQSLVPESGLDTRKAPQARQTPTNAQVAATPAASSARTSSTKEPAKPAAPALISTDQRRELFTFIVSEGWSNEQVREILKTKFGFEDTKQVTVDKLQAVYAAFKYVPQEEQREPGQDEAETFVAGDDDLPEMMHD